MNILCIGDIVGKLGRDAFVELLPGLKKEHNIDFVVVNAENAAGGNGLTPRIADDLIQHGCDVITLGDHVWDQKDIMPYLDQTDRVLRPANFPEGAPGRGWCVRESASGKKIGVVTVLGRTFMRYNVECPFKRLDVIVNEIRKETPIIVAEIHTEATSEKVAIGHFIDGKASLVFGTHTHIQTADEKILAGKTAYITDLGMTGPCDSVIGQDKFQIIQRFLTSLPIKFNVASGDITLQGIVVDIDDSNGHARSITRIQKKFSPTL